MMTNAAWGIILLLGIVVSAIEGAANDAKNYNEKSKNDFDYIDYKNWRI